jgi:hypothetical protein
MARSRRSAHELRFNFGDVFPADDILSEWLITVSMASNDLILVHLRMEADQNEEHLMLHWFRLAVAHFHEVGKHLQETRNVPEIRTFIRSLPQPTQARYAIVLDTYKRRKRALGNIRNGTFHYPSLMEWRSPQTIRQKRDLNGVLRASAREQAAIRAGRLRESRLLFADELTAKLLVRKTGGIPNYRSLQGDVRAGIQEFMRFMNEAVEEHLLRAREAGATIRRVP